MTAPIDLITHRVECYDPHAHLFRVTLRIPKPSHAQQIAMAVWIPGSYLIREFAKQVQSLCATQDGKPVPTQQIDKCTWQLTCAPDKTVEVSYFVYAFDTSVRTAYLDSIRGFFNGTSLFMRVTGQEHTQQVIRVTPPQTAQNWRVATALSPLAIEAGGWGEYLAQHYDELADSPFELGDFWEGSFKIRGIHHRFVVSGATATFDGKRLLADTKKIVAAALSFWHGSTGKAPADLVKKGYLFMLHATAEGYGGLEHMNSTALIAKRSDLPRLGEQASPKGYITLLGLISHEYFHTWNVKRLRPSELVPYTYERENLTTLLWFFEGFTSYFDDYLLHRAGLISHEHYVGLVAKTINQVLQTPGRLVHPLASSSFEAWTKYYRMDENSVNSTVSYYTKGSLVALCLDLMLRNLGLTLESVMQQLWQVACANSVDGIASITEKDILDALPNKACRQALLQWVHTTDDLPLSKLLETVGIKAYSNVASMAQQLGLVVSTEGQNMKVKQVLSDSIACKAGFSAGDEWLAIEVQGEVWRLSSLDDVALYAPPTKPFQAWVTRDKRIHKLTGLVHRGAAQNGDINLSIVDALQLKIWLER